MQAFYKSTKNICLIYFLLTITDDQTTVEITLSSEIIEMPYVDSHTTRIGNFYDRFYQ